MQALIVPPSQGLVRSSTTGRRGIWNRHQEVLRALGPRGPPPPQELSELQVRGVGARAAEELHEVGAVWTGGQARDVPAEELGQPHEGHRPAHMAVGPPGCPWPRMQGCR